MSTDDNDEPVPVRIVKYTMPYDGTPAGNTRLTFDAWVFGILFILTVVANIIY